MMTRSSRVRTIARSSVDLPVPAYPVTRRLSRVFRTKSSVERKSAKPALHSPTVSCRASASSASGGSPAEPLFELVELVARGTEAGKEASTLLLSGQSRLLWKAALRIARAEAIHLSLGDLRLPDALDPANGRSDRVRRRELIGLVAVADGVRAETVALGCICPRSDRPVAGCRSRSRRAVRASVCARFAMRAGLVPTQVGDQIYGVAGGAPLVSKAA